MDALQTAWADAWRGVGVSDAPPETLAELVAAYDVPGRFYHNTRHVADCLAKLADCQNAAERPSEIALALFFHDAIYDTHASDNEAQSAALVVRALRDQNAAGDTMMRVHDLVLATRHTNIPLTGDAALIADIDLSILGADVEAFWNYERAIRREYEWVPANVFAEKRAEVLAPFLHRDRIFRTDVFAPLEAAARRNLEASIAALAG